jgi:uncharacterized damage-inducible protein DinB
MKQSSILLALAFSAVTLPAQNKLSAELKQNYSMSKDLVIRAAEKMSDADYSFKPTAQVRTFGEVVGHVIEAHNFMCNPGTPPKQEPKRTAKAEIVKALRDSYTVCDTAYNSLTDAKAMQTVKMFGQDQTLLSVLWGNVAHDNEMYGTMAVYLRLKGIVPPSSEGPPPGAGKKK